MELKRLLMLQEEVEAAIMQRCEKKGLNITDEERLKSMIMELFCETGELANECQVHKYWKHDKQINEEKQLEELADIWLSLFAVTNLLDYSAKDITDAIVANYGKGIQRQREGY
jgi:dimeric dUTPase (all-alpha-NTP-PPase superfamily)